MAEVEIRVAGRGYRIHCREGEEAKLHDVAALVDAKAQSAVAALGQMGEARQLLFAALMLADGIHDASAAAEAPAGDAAVQDAIAETLEGLAERLESFADELEAEASAS